MPSANLNLAGGIYTPMDGSKLRIASLVGAMGLFCATGIAVAASASSPRGTSDLHLAARMLKTHNDERVRLNLPKLKWNVHLEKEARDWAYELSRKGSLVHADRPTRNGTGENLWMGTAGNWPVETMVGMFIEERRHYRPGAFPNVSRTGNWKDVGHYTQVIWRDTQEVGCALVTERGNDVLVCRYWPAGNVWGSEVN